MTNPPYTRFDYSSFGRGGGSVLFEHAVVSGILCVSQLG